MDGELDQLSLDPIANSFSTFKYVELSLGIITTKTLVMGFRICDMDI